MNYQYLIEGGRRRLTGTLSSGELPDLMYMFGREANYRDAAAFIENRSLVAAKGDRIISLRIFPTECYVPGKAVNDAIAFMMDMAL